MDALEFIDKVLMKRRSVFTFFDPPYYKKGSGLYTNYYLHEDHHNLANYIQRKLKKWKSSPDSCVKNAIQCFYHFYLSKLMYFLEE